MNAKILIVDDEPDILSFLHTALGSQGNRVSDASGGREALKLYQSKAFDLVITDIKMPEMDGLEMIKRMKLHNSDAEFIVLTGYGTVDFAVQALRNEGAFDFLHKPLTDIDELFIVVEQALEKLKLRRKNTELLSELKAQKVVLEKQNQELRRIQAELRRLSAQLLSTQEDERKRVALEVHDTVGQSLCAVKLKVEAALQLLEKQKPSQAVKFLQPIVSMIQETIDEVRRIERILRPPVLDSLGILATISWLCEGFEQVYQGVRIEKEIEIEEIDIPESLKIVIYRILQMVFHNIAEHSQAQMVRLSLKKTQERIELIVTDNGIGFDIEYELSDANTEKGFGLTSIKERTGLSGGTFSIESHKGAGTTIQLAWIG